MFDRTLLALALKNVLENAILYAPPESEIEVSVQKTGKELHIATIDKGPGMTPEEARHLTGRFNRGRHGREGTGLGLSIVDMAVRKLGGRLSFEKQAKSFAVQIVLPLNGTKFVEPVRN
ncbi:MAG: sensor histidine kinase [Micropruina sp.]|uniref:sensor histidine kinase n=1 Tax=Micropruina sp. TaxID=2737536 RepID=UPI0039E48C75